LNLALSSFLGLRATLSHEQTLLSLFANKDVESSF
jgi:hypothetical protein